MERIILVNCAVLCVIILYLGVVLSVPQNYETTRDEDKTDRDKESYMWFGPRLGRRKRNPNGDETYRNQELEREQLSSLMNILQESPWIMVTKPNDDKRHTVSFTPRLGRESGEEENSDKWLQDPELYSELLSLRSPPFAPRLGRRRLLPYSPRLGRENDKS